MQILSKILGSISSFFIGLKESMVEARRLQAEYYIKNSSNKWD